MNVIAVIDTNENTKERLNKLKGLLANELKSDKPSTTYAEDLTISIMELQKRLGVK